MRLTATATVLLLTIFVLLGCNGTRDNESNVVYEMDINNVNFPQRDVSIESNVSKELNIEEVREKEDILTSTIFMDPCCMSAADPAFFECCGPIVLAYYEEKLKNGDWEAIDTLMTSDQVFNKLRYSSRLQSKFDSIEVANIQVDDDEEWN